MDSNEEETAVTIEYKKGGWVNKSAKFAVEARIPVKAGSSQNYVIGGTWQEGVTVNNEETGEEFDIWRPNPLPENSEWNQNFTRMTLQLNHIPEQLQSQLPPTDVRLRPDQRALENGDLDRAASEKHRLEEK